MADEQAGSNPPEELSYDAQMRADVAAAFTEVNTPDEPEAKAEPEVRAEPEVKSDRARDELGRFAPKTDKADTPEIKAEPAKEPEKAPEVVAQAPGANQAPAAAPPGGWSVKSKSEWDKLPEHIRADILKREEEVNKGFSEYAGMRELRPYVEQARSQGQSLKQVLDNFIGMENLLRQNPIQGFQYIASKLGMSPQQLAQAFGGAGYSNGQYTQEGYQQPADGQAPYFDPALMQQWLNPVVQKVHQMESLFQQQQEAQQARELSTINTVLERFTSDPAHRYYQNVEQRMTQLFASGVVPRTGDYAADLKAAYDMACRLDPEISELLLNERLAKAEESRKQAEKEAAEKAKAASRSLTGSPTAGAVVEADADDDSIEATVRRAYRAHAA